MKMFEVVKVVDTEAIQVGENEEFRFRLEICNEINSNAYFGKVYRLETYRLQPTFPQLDGNLPSWMNDALIYVLDEVFNPIDLMGSSPQEVLNSFQKELSEKFDE